jgi:16S rRNA (guanine527-N7)-methyltransferase
VGYLDVFLLFDFYIVVMEKTNEKLELIEKYFNDFSDKQVAQFNALFSLYTEWNEKINVISRKDIESLYLKHVLHSLSIAATFSFVPGMEIVDIGTGGGFPGIPLAIFFPEVKFLLADSIAKKIKVVGEISAAIELSNVEPFCGRVESIKSRKFDFAVSRAVAPLKDLWNWSKPLLKKERKMEDFKNGLICLKGGDLTQEIADSQLRPYVTEIESVFNEEYFKEKYILYVPV